jgi:protein-L-isoaspartate(D-aspartate) O-methyltransferase
MSSGGDNLAQALRAEGIRDERVLAAIARVPREHFVDGPFVDLAYENTALPIACGQTISQPFVVAYMTEVLELNEQARVLEIGTGSGYQTAVLSLLCRRVYTVERHRSLLQVAERRFRDLALHNIATRFGDGLEGWQEQAPFDRILLTAAVEQVPEFLLDQLKPGGILVAPVGSQTNSESGFAAESFCQLLTKIIRSEAGFSRKGLIPVVFVPMVAGVPQHAPITDSKQRQ